MESTLIVRPLRPTDMAECGRVIFDGFAQLADRHGFERDFPTAEAALGFTAILADTPSVRGIVAERGDEVIGCNFIDLAAPVAGIGPLAVDPTTQDRGVGRMLMEAAAREAATADFTSVRFMQSAYNNASMALYTKLGFRVCATAAVMRGGQPAELPAGYELMTARLEDVTRCTDLCRTVLRFDREAEVTAAIHAGTASILLRSGHLCGYTTGIGFTGHSVAHDNDGLKSLILSGPETPGLGFFIPMANHDLFAWCLSRGSQIVMQMNLMCRGTYDEPTGAWMPSILR